MVFDGHSDLLYDVTRRRLAGEKRVLERRHLRNLEAGGVEGLTLALWVSAQDFWKNVPEAKGHRERTDIMLLCMKAELAECPWLELVRTTEEAERAKAAGKKYAFLAVEGMDAIGDDLNRIDRYADLGVQLVLAVPGQHPHPNPQVGVAVDAVQVIPDGVHALHSKKGVLLPRRFGPLRLLRCSD